MGIDNALIELDAEEPPICDGSSAPFIELIRDCGTSKQNALAKTLTLSAPLTWSQGDSHLVAIPHHCYHISATLCYPGEPLLDAQYHSIEISPETFATEIAPCRTFARYADVAPLLERGLIKGGSLDNALVVKGDQLLSKTPLRFSNEMVRHKILDLVGDLALLGGRLQAHVIAIRAGHTANCALARTIQAALMQKDSEV